MSKDYPWGKGTPKWMRDATLNDSDKTFTVPAGKIWCVIAFHAELVATATVGNRNIQVSIGNGAAAIWSMTRSGNIAASATGAVRGFVHGYNSATAGNVPLLDGSATAGATSSSPIPELYLPAGYTIHIWDVNAVDAAADDMTVVLQYVEYDA